MYPKIDEPQKYAAALYLRLSKDDEKKDKYPKALKIKSHCWKGMQVKNI